MEGLFTPEQLQTPFDKARVLKALVRIHPHIYFLASVFEREEDVAAFRPAHEKTFLAEGATLWHVALTKAQLEQIRAEPGLSLQPGLFEITQAFEGVTAFPAQRVVRLEGAAVGFFISSDGLFLTNYHVMREEIEAAGRTAGSSDARVCRYVSFEIPVVKRERIVGWKPLRDVKLVKNLSAQEWQQGYDAALLQAPIKAPVYLPLAKRRPVVGEEIWSFGFPIRTKRSRERLQAVGYRDADGSLRISYGKITEIPSDHTFVTDCDGFNGNSGSPALTREGAVLGYAWNVYPDGETQRRAVVFEGGTIHVMLGPVLERLHVAS
jgi:S1-C subfamily serine protease